MVAKRDSVAGRPPVTVPVVVGFKLKPNPDADLTARMRAAFEATVEAPANYKDPAKIEEYRRAACEDYRASEARRPYTSVFDRVVFIVPTFENAVGWSSEGRDRDSGKPSVAALAAGWLGKAFDGPRNAIGAPSFVLCGFDIELFVHVLYTACAAAGTKISPLTWLRDDMRCDVGNLITPRGYGKFLTPQMALLAFGDEVAGVKTAGFTPGVDPDDDVRVAFELLARLDLLGGRS